jgi:hypothetical protein
LPIICRQKEHVQRMSHPTVSETLESGRKSRARSSWMRETEHDKIRLVPNARLQESYAARTSEERSRPRCRGHCL